MNPCAVVVFGGTGDLTQRLLFPSVCRLATDGLLDDGFALIGFARSPLTSHEYFERLWNALPEPRPERRVQDWLRERVEYHRGDIGNASDFESLREQLRKTDARLRTGGNLLFYCATAPEHFGRIVEQLAHAGLLENSKSWRRVIIEKPFGTDLESAITLNQELRRFLEESQIYRIDHYLGKETVQNILVFRFANEIFEPIWNRKYVESVHVTVAETLGVEGRAAYYDRAGALRDMVPSHLFQLVALTAMEPPSSFKGDDLRNEKTKLLNAIPEFNRESVLRNTVRGQYGRGRDAQGRELSAYRDEPGVNPRSMTETFVALRLMVDNWRWSGVPFFLRTGKRLAKRMSEVTLRFRCPPLQLFRSLGLEPLCPNRLTIQIQPDERISLQFGTKVPGPSMQVSETRMEFSYAREFASQTGEKPRIGYETLLYDCICGDQTLFQREDQIESSWRIVTPVLRDWEREGHRVPLYFYPSMSWGPPEAEMLIHREEDQCQYERR